MYKFMLRFMHIRVIAISHSHPFPYARITKDCMIPTVYEAT